MKSQKIATYVLSNRVSIYLLTNFYSRARTFREDHESLAVANFSRRKPVNFAMNLSYGCYHNMGLDKVLSRTLVVANQFISGKSRNKVDANNSWFTVFHSATYKQYSTKISDQYLVH